MKILVIKDGKKYFLSESEKKKAPKLTQDSKLALTFENLARAQAIRDDVLEYYPGSMIVGYPS